MTTPLTIRLKIEDVVHPDFRDLASEFECAICCALFDDPVQLLCSNRHIFCLACVREGAFQACPICLDPLPKTGAKFVALHEPAGAPHSHRMMMKLKCRCPHYDGPVFEECITATEGAVGKHDGLDGSSSGGAGTGGSAAAAASSSAAYPKKRARVDSDEDDLDDDRDAAPAKCLWGTDLKGEYGDLITKHLGMCPLHPVLCQRAGCGVVVRRWALEKHDRVCRVHLEACSICGELVRPEDMAEHRTTAAGAHVQILEQKLAARDTTIAQLEKTTGDAHTDLRKEIGELGKAVQGITANMVSKTQVTSLSKKIVEHSAGAACRLVHSPDVIIWSVKTADLFMRCRKKGDFVYSDLFCVNGFGPVRLHLYGYGHSKMTASDKMGISLAHVTANDRETSPALQTAMVSQLKKFEIISSLSVIAGPQSDADTSDRKKILWESKSEFLGPGEGWGSVDELAVSKLKQHSEITLTMKITGVRVALATSGHLAR